MNLSLGSWAYFKAAWLFGANHKHTTITNSSKYSRPELFNNRIYTYIHVLQFRLCLSIFFQSMIYFEIYYLLFFFCYLKSFIKLQEKINNTYNLMIFDLLQPTFKFITILILVALSPFTNVYFMFLLEMLIIVNPEKVKQL